MEKDNINPNHYKGKADIQIIDLIVEVVDNPVSYCFGNVVKYIMRYDNKNGREDLEKALWYINKAIELWEVHETCPYPITGLYTNIFAKSECLTSIQTDFISILKNRFVNREILKDIKTMLLEYFTS